ncbi:MAG: hypothetical protein IPJ51_09245 [Saprospiraceae bacterium]|nr:hypothetical protein [Saprospiraceae bacterium]
MLSSTQKRFSLFALFLFVLFGNNYNLTAQCNLNITNFQNPSSCYASDGFFTANAINGACGRLIRIYKNNAIIAQGNGTVIASGLSSGEYEIIADNNCGCSSPSTQIITLFSGTSTPLTPYVDAGLGSYQADKVYICRGSNLRIGVQSLGLSGFQLSGPNGFSDTTPDGNSYWNLSNLQPSHAGRYTISFTNAAGCISTVNINVEVGTLAVNLGPDKAGCFGISHTLAAGVSGQGTCSGTCPSTLDSLLVRWTLDQCNASNQNNQYDYTELQPEYPSNGNCISVTAKNVYRSHGEHSCTPVLGSYTGDVGICIPAMDSCNPLLYNSDNAVKIEVTITPQEAGRLSKISFKEQSPLQWITTNGSTGVNNYNTKYLVRVYKNNLLIYAEDERNSERTWNLETIDFGDLPAFAVTETSTFRIELRGYCVIQQQGGNMSGWELDDIRIFGGCCTGLPVSDSVSYLWSNGETTPSITVTPSQNTNYTVTVTDCKGCTSTDEIGITVFPLPIASISGKASICVGGTTVLTASGGATYLWSTGATASSIISAPAATTLYSVTVTSSDGCSSTASLNVVVNPLPSPVITGDFEICIGQSTALTASGGMSYEWSTGEFGPTITVSPLVSTTYLVMAMDENGCMEYTSALVVVNPLPVPILTGDNEICLGESTVLTATGGTGFLWSTGSIESIITVSPTISSNYTVTVTDSNGCSASTAMDVIVNPLPVAIISGNTTFCTGASSLLTASGGSSYVWNTGATTSSIMVNPGMNTAYTVTVTDGKGCTSSASRMTSVNTLPEANIEGAKKICQGSTTTLIASGGVIFSWNTGQTTSAINVSPASTTIYRVTVTDVNGCTGTSAHAVIVTQNPVVNISGKNEFCVGESTVLTANVSGTTYCDKDCIDEILLQWSLDQCNSDGLPNQLSYTEFIPTTVNAGGLNTITGTHLKRDRGDHSCTPDGTGGVGLCFGALDSCDPNLYNPLNGLKFSVRMQPNEVGKLTKLTFREQSPLNWVTTNGSTGINNYNQKYLIRVYKDGNLVYSKNNLNTERDWNLETFDFTDHPEFRITTLSLFTFELYGYCTVERGGTAGWEIDDIRIYGGECSSSPSIDNISYLWSTGATSESINVSPLLTTSYAVTVSDCNGCIGSDDYLVNVNPLPTPSITGDNELCFGESTTLAASGGSSYVWSNGATTSSITVGPTTTTTFSVTVTDDKGCTGNTSETVIVNPLPTPTIAGVNELCFGESTTLIASGGISYLWSNGATTSSITVGPTTTTIYIVTVTDDKGCTANTSETVIVNPLPIPTIAGVNELCFGESTTLTASGGSSYLWSNGATTSSITVGPTTTTTFSVTVTDDKGCIASTSETVIVNPLPTPSISGDNELCLGESTTLTASGGSSYVWSNGSTTSSITVSPTTTTTFSVTVTDDKGCIAITSETVFVNPLPVPSITGVNELCFGESTSLAASGGSSYVWSNGSTTSSITVSPTTTTTYSVTVTDDKGCIASTSETVIVNPLPVPSITGDNEICFGESTTLTTSGGSIYVWSNGSTTSSITVSPTTTTTYSVTVTDDKGCIVSTSETVIVNSLPTPSITGDNELCFGESTTLTASGGSIYEWSNGSTTSSITVSPTTTTTYNVTVNDDKGCIASTSETVIVNPLPTPTISGDTEICFGESTTLTAIGGSNYEWSNGSTTSSVTVNPTTTTTYGVTVTDGNSCSGTSSVTVVVNPLPAPTIIGDTELCVGESTGLFAVGGVGYVWSNGSTTGLINVSPTTTTTYSVTVTDNKGCTANTIVTVIVNPLPTPSITGDNELCFGESTTLTVSGGSIYEWSNGSTASSISVSPTANTTYSVTVTDGNGCSGRASVTVKVNALPEVNISGDKEICLNECTTLTASGGVSYEWSNVMSNGYSCSGAFYVGGPQGGSDQSLYVINSGNNLTTIGSLGTNNVNGIGYYCQGGNTPYIYGMKMRGNTITDALRANFVRINPETAALSILNEIPQPPNPYGLTGTTGIMAYIGEVSKEGIYYFPAVSALINPLTFSIVDYTIYLGSIDLNNHGNGSNVNYRVISVLPGCKPYMDACIEAFQRYALDPSGREPSGGIQDWALSEDGKTMYSYFGIENALFRMDMGTASTNCVAGPVSNGIYTGVTGVKTDEFGGIYFRGGELYGLQVDRGRLFRIDRESGLLTLVTEGLPMDYRGDNATCGDCGNPGTSPIDVDEVTVCPTETTTYGVKVTDINGCVTTATVTVKVNSLPTPTISGDTEICNGESTTLTAGSGSSYVWSNGSTTSSVTVNPTTTTTYGVTVTDGNSCSGTSSVTVVVNPLPTPSIIGDTEICRGESTGLFAVGGSSYVWSNGSTTGLINVSPTTTTTYSVTVTDNKGCTANTSVTVIVNPLPTPSIAGDNELCFGESTTLTASGGSIYEWSNGATTSSITVNPTTTTTYGVTVTDGNGCSGSTSVTVKVNALPEVNISGDKEICLNECTTLTASGGVSYEWSNVMSNGYSCSGAFYVGGPQGGSDQSLYVINSGNNLTTIGSLGTNNVNGIGYYCQGGNTPYIYGMKMRGNTITDALRANFVRINPETAALSILNEIPQPPNPYGLTGTTGIMAYIGEVSKEGIYYFPAVSALINPLTFSIVDYTIYLGSIDLNNHGNGSNVNYRVISVLPGCKPYMDACIEAFQRYALDPSGREPSGGIQDWALSEDGKTMYSYFGIENALFRMDMGTASTNCVAGPVSNGIYTGVTGVKTDEFGGIYFRGGELYGLQVDRGRLFSIDRESGLLTLVTEGLPMDYRGDNATCGDCGNPGTSPIDVDEVTVCPTETTTYGVKVTDINGCVTTATVTVKVNSLPTPTISGDTEICFGESTILTAIGGSNYTWSNGATTSSITVNPTTTTTYGVTVTDGNSCSGTSSVTVVVNPLPTPSIIGDTEICRGESTGLFVVGGSSYVWSNGSTTGLINVSPTTTTTYSVTVTDNKGCTANTSVTVIVNPLPTPSIAGDNELCFGESTTLTASGGSIYEWSNGATTSSITVNPTTTTMYGVTVTDGNGCSSSTSVTVKVNALPEVNISGDKEICLNECTTLTASGGVSYEWSNVMSSGYSCSGAFYVGGPQGGSDQSLYVINSGNNLTTIGSLGTNNVNGIGYYCQGGNTPYIYGMKMRGNTITDALRANFVRINPETAALSILNEIPQPPNPYGLTGTTGIMAYIGEVSKEGIYYFPAVSALINPLTFSIVDYTIYLGSIDLNNHGNGSNVNYRVISVLPGCKPYMDACIEAFQRYALDPSGREPSGGIQDWALSEDGKTMYSYFGIENALFRMDMGTASTNCVAGPVSNGIYTE